MGKSQKVTIALLGTILFLLLIPLLLYFSKPHINVKNNLNFQNFSISKINLLVFLYKHDYLNMIDSLHLEYTDLVQEQYQLTNKGDRVVSIGVEKVEKDVTIYIEYNSYKYDEYVFSNKVLDSDFFASICKALEGPVKSPETCYQDMSGMCQ